MKSVNLEFIGLCEDVLRRGADLRIRVTGRSMYPFLKGGEVLTIRQVPYPSLRRGDLILYKSLYNKPVLHRILRIELSLNNTIIFFTKGDASRLLDKPVRQNKVLGKVSKIEKISSDSYLKHIDLESNIWRKINFLIALIHWMYKKSQKTYN